MKNLKRTREFKVGSQTLEILEKSWANKLTRTNLGKVCIVCNDPKVQMHHIRRGKQLKQKQSHLDWFKMQMAAINRKRVP
jgi:uncharacterized protein YegJ (DUF2314 family)